MIKEQKKIFMGYLNPLGDESCENDPAEVRDVVEQEREELQEGGVWTPETGLPLSRARTPAWSRMVLPAQLHLLSAIAVTLRNPSAKAAHSKSMRASVWTNDLSSFLQGKRWIYKEATKGIKEAAEKAAKNLA